MRVLFVALWVVAAASVAIWIDNGVSVKELLEKHWALRGFLIVSAFMIPTAVMIL